MDLFQSSSNLSIENVLTVPFLYGETIFLLSFTINEECNDLLLSEFSELLILNKFSFCFKNLFLFIILKFILINIFGC